MIEIKKINNNYIINDKDIIIVNRLIKYRNKLSKKLIDKLIKKLDVYHINYRIDEIKVIYDDNRYEYYRLKFIMDIEIKNEVNNICKYLEDNILRKKIGYLFKEIDLVIDG